MTAGYVSEGRVADDLYDLSEALGKRDPESQAHGFLGGEWGYGQDFENDVFEMHPFWWGDCECGYEEREVEWENSHRHAADCYRTALHALGDVAFGDDRGPALARSWGLPERGWGVHCTCGREDARLAWVEAHPHPDHCPQVRPNFRHKPSGTEVRWYKYIGRSMDGPHVTKREWQSIVDECEASLAEQPLVVLADHRTGSA